MAPITAAAPDMSCFISSMPPLDLMEMPPLSKVIPFPTKTRVSRSSEGSPYSRIMKRGGSSLPALTAIKAPMRSFSMSFRVRTRHLRSQSAAIFRAAEANLRGGSAFPGALERSRASAVPAAVIRAVSIPSRTSLACARCCITTVRFSSLVRSGPSDLWQSYRYSPSNSPSTVACVHSCSSMSGTSSPCTAVESSETPSLSARLTAIPDARRAVSKQKSLRAPSPRRITLRGGACPHGYSTATSCSSPLKSPSFRMPCR